MMKRTFNCVLALSSSIALLHAHAIGTGFYLGLMTGPATNSGPNQQAQLQSTIPGVNPGTVTAKPRSNQWGSRFFMGYQIYPYVGFEAGLNYFSTIHYSLPPNVTTCSGTSTRVRNFDILGRIAAPFCWFDVYAKGGVAIVYETTSGAFNSSPNGTCGKNQYRTLFRPTFSIGGSYELNQSWVTDLSWNRIMVGSPAGNVDFYAIGLSYHFVDKYCGQFLCD